MAGRATPVMQQFHAAKRAYPDCVLFFRMGDFYEMFEDDAVLVARQLDLTLTARNKGKPDEVPMAGVPHHSAHGYVARLLEQGYKVAICEQMADPSKIKGIVPREVVRVLTPGTITDADQLSSRRNNWLAAVEIGEEGGGVGIALLDLSTGELMATELSDLTTLVSELARSSPSEVLLSVEEDWDAQDALEQTLGKGVAVRDDEALTEDEVAPALGPLATDAAKLGMRAQRAAARALRFVRACNPLQELPPVRRIGSWDPRGHLVIDATAQSHLELVASLAGDKETTLLETIDSTKTPAGARLLRRRLLAPLLDVNEIRRRLDRVELFLMHPRLREELAKPFKNVGDIERLAVRATLREANPRDLGALRDGLLACAMIVRLLQGHSDKDQDARQTLGLTEKVDEVAELASLLEQALVERPPAQPKDGSVFRPDFDAELAELDTLRKHGAERVVELEARLREELDIPKLRIKFTRVFGWYVEVVKSQADRVPGDWRRKQTVAAGERYTLPELDDLADAISGAEDSHRERELALIKDLVERAAEAAPRIVALSERIARWDVAAALADVAHRYDYCRPTVDDSPLLELKESRHPVVERLAAAGRFVPNDVTLDRDAGRLWIITGPNMAGKSTLLRQVALTTILAQMGSYVPAAEACVGLVDRVLSRVGASDNLARGESTFMVEMRETADILRGATERSLVILDEIGRGTSTFDGLAIAWAVAEHLDDAVRCRALFATHYHELTALAEQSDHVENHSVSAKELEGDIVFLHRLVPGAASRSYGVAVAKLAGLPESALARAQALLSMLEGDQGEAEQNPAISSATPFRTRRKRRKNAAQLELFGAGESEVRPEHAEVIDTLKAANLDRMTPLDALQLLAKLKKRLG